MSEELARRVRDRNREAFQRWLDAALTPVSAVPAAQVRDRWEPIVQFIEEGPDVGAIDVAESEAGQRIN